MAKNDIFTVDTLKQFLADSIESREEYEESEIAPVLFVDEEFTFVYDGVEYDVSVYAENVETFVSIRVNECTKSDIAYYIGGKMVESHPYEDVFDAIEKCIPREFEYEVIM